MLYKLLKEMYLYDIENFDLLLDIPPKPISFALQSTPQGIYSSYFWCLIKKHFQSKSPTILSLDDGVHTHLQMEWGALI